MTHTEFRIMMNGLRQAKLNNENEDECFPYEYKYHRDYVISHIEEYDSKIFYPDTALLRECEII